tara:strand:- start:123586 stop:124668 length:1083 start_codon:yes stop_codon:yes gene_type:complete
MATKAPLLPDIMASDLTKVAIFLGAQPDPDGLASQHMMAELIRIKNPSVIIGKFHRGDFSHPQNSTMVQLLGMDSIPYSEFNKDDGWSTIISCDGPPSVCPSYRTESGGTKTVIPDFVIDHHEQKGPKPSGGADVRPIGSCSSIMWEYAMESGYDFGTEEGVKLATALGVGINTDTRFGGEESCSPLDYEALAYCQINKDDKLYRDILNYPKPEYFMDLMVDGWKHKVPEGNVLVTGIGTLNPARVWVVPALAEEYLKMSGVDTTVVFAIIEGPEGNYIKISVRSNRSSLNVDTFTRQAFGSGGGKRGAGAATVSVPPLLQCSEASQRDKFYEAVREMIIHKTLQTANDGARSKKEEAAE